MCNQIRDDHRGAGVTADYLKQLHRPAGSSERSSKAVVLSRAQQSRRDALRDTLKVCVNVNGMHAIVIDLTHFRVGHSPMFM